MRKFLSRSFWLAVVVALGTVLWGLWYVSHRGFTRKWRQVVISEVEKRGVHLTVGRLTLNPFQGLVARDVQIWTSKERDRAMASVNEVVLDLNYSNLVHGEPFLNAAELRNATLSLPLESSVPERKNERLEISHLNARVLLPAHHLTVEQAEAVVRGLHVTVSGHFVNPEQFQWKQESKPSGKSPLLHVSELLHAVDDLQMAGGRPSLQIRFSGDLAKPSELFVETALQAERFSLNGGYTVESVKLAATLAEGRVRIDECEIKDAHGALNATGTVRIAAGEADLQLRSTLDLPELLHAVRPGSNLKELVLTQPPLLELSGSANFRGTPSFQLLGHLGLGAFSVKSLAFESAGTDFSWASGGRWYLHDTRIQHKDGSFILNAMQAPGDFRFTLDSQINPAVFFPVLPPEARTRIAEWEFRTNPVLHLDGRGPACDPGTVEISGHAQLGATRARGILLKSATVDLGFKNNVLTCQNIKLERAEGTGGGTVVYDFNTDELQFQNVKTTLNPVEVVRIFDRELAEQLMPYRFKTRPALVVNGKVGCRHDDWQRNNLRVEVTGDRGMDYTFLKKELSANKITGTVTILGDRLKLEGLNAAIWGGRLRGRADISLRKSAGDYTAELHTEEIDFPSLTKLYFDYDTSKGKLNGSFAFSGLHDLTRAIDGKGELAVIDGNVFAIPIFGPFSGIMNELLPGYGYNDARKGTCTFEMRDGVVTTKDLVMEGRGFSIIGRGALFIVDDKMDFTARINVQGFAGKFLVPVGYLLEYVSDGSLSKPIWRPKRLPKIIFAPRGASSPPPVSAPPSNRPKP